LTSLWFTSAELGAGGRIVDWCLDVNRTHSTTFIRIEVGSHREVLSENDLDAFGKPLGLDGLVEQAEFRKSIIEAELDAQGRKVPVTLHQYTLPKTTIFVLGSNARITAIDADSGRQNWSVAFGSLSQPNIGVHADDFHVAAINGSNVFCFEALTGKFIWSHHCRGPVAAPPVVFKGKIFVPLLDGRLEIFDIENEGFGSYPIIATGTPTARPLVTSRVIAWPTNVGYLNFTATERRLARTLIYRLKADGYIDSTPTYRDDFVFTGSGDGFVYAIEEHTGSLYWQVSLGAPISQSPFVHGDRVYAITNDKRMYCMSARTGEMMWDKPLAGIGQYLGASEEKIYLTDGFRSLLVVEPTEGRVLSTADVGQVSAILPNRDTDRLYVATSTGIVYCVHEIGSPVPYFHPDKIEEVAAARRAREERRRARVNPFEVIDEGGDANPFGTDDDANPFGAGAAEENPFGAGDKDTNPFGADDQNPFGTDDKNPAGTSADGQKPGSDGKSAPPDDDPFK
jgi:outer membrane protein assembly factor BamB